MAEASKKYSGLDGLGVSEFYFNFEGFDENTELTSIYRNGKVLAPSDKDWERAKDSKQALEAYNIARYDRPTGQTSIDVADDDILNARYLVAFGNESNVETGPRSTGTSDRNFYTGGVVSGPRSFGSPNKVQYKKGSDIRTFAYPINIDIKEQDYLQINKFAYVRGRSGSNANLSGPKKTLAGKSAQGKQAKGTVILPMPKVSDSNGAEWGDSELNVFGVGAVGAVAAAGGAVKKTLTDGFNIKEIRNAMGGLQAIAPDLIGDVTGAVSVAGALGGSALLETLGITVSPDQLLARATGNIINPNAELLFQGPVLRDFAFQYLMVARSQDEGREIRKIIRWFKEGAAPKYQNQALLGTPDIFSLEYNTPGNEGILNKFHDMALRTITVDYAPDGFWSAYEDSHPVAVRMSLQFTELKPVYDKDYDSPEGAGGVGY